MAVYATCCGVDVHQTFLVATIIKMEGVTPSYIKKRFPTFNRAVIKFKQWLVDNNCYDVCIAANENSWKRVYKLLAGSIRVTVASPKWVEAVKCGEGDIKDSKWIGNLFRLGLIPGDGIPESAEKTFKEKDENL